MGIQDDKNVRCIYLSIVVSPYVRGLSAYVHLYMYYILWPLAPLIIQQAYCSNMVSEPKLVL